MWIRISSVQLMILFTSSGVFADVIDSNQILDSRSDSFLAAFADLYLGGDSRPDFDASTQTVLRMDGESWPGHSFYKKYLPVVHSGEWRTETSQVPEPGTGILLVTGLVMLLAMRHTMPVNLHSVHSRLRAQRGQAPTR